MRTSFIRQRHHHQIGITIGIVGCFAFLSLHKFTIRCHLASKRIQRRKNTSRVHLYSAHLLCGLLLLLFVVMIVIIYLRDIRWNAVQSFLHCAFSPVSPSFWHNSVTINSHEIIVQIARTRKIKQKKRQKETRPLNFLIYAYCGGAFFALWLLCCYDYCLCPMRDTFRMYAFHCCLSLCMSVYSPFFILLNNIQLNYCTERP